MDAEKMVQRGEDVANDLEATLAEALRTYEGEDRAAAVAVVFSASARVLADVIQFAAALGGNCAHKVTAQAIRALIMYADMGGGSLAGSPLLGELERIAAELKGQKPGLPAPWTPPKKYDA